MKLTQCPNGHYYDDTRSAECPFCHFMYATYESQDIEMRNVITCDHCNKAVPVCLKLLLDQPSNRKIISIVSCEDEIIIAGRDKNAKLRLSDIYIARQHAVFVYKTGHWYIADTGSVNGTFLNGRRLEPYKYVALVSGDIISFANKERFKFMD